MSARHSVTAALAVVTLLAGLRVDAQNRGLPPGPAQARTAAPIDLTGYWVSFVTEDWRYRMVTPPKGDYAGVPMTPEARKIADAWDPAADEAAGNPCKSYGAAAIMRVPTRLHVTWQDDNTLRIDTDAGQQSRLFHFGPPPAKPVQPAWQGHSNALWERPAPPRGANPAAPPSGGSLKVLRSTFPLRLSAHAAREKAIRHGHPSTLQ